MPEDEQKPDNKSAKSVRKMGLTPVFATVSTFSIYFAAQIIGVNLVGFIAVLAGLNSSEIVTWFDDNTYARFFAYLAIAIVGLALVRAVLKWTRTTWSGIGFKLPKPIDALYALIGYGYYLPLFIVVSLIVSAFFPTVDLQQDQQLGFNTAAQGLELFVIFVSLVVLPPLYEEILMRGLLYTGLRRKLSLLPAALITSVLFAVAHLQWGSGAPLLWAAAIDTFILSLVLVALREKTGSLWPAIGLHAIKNFVAFSILFIFKLA